jgi:hypothetical protein
MIGQYLVNNLGLYKTSPKTESEAGLIWISLLLFIWKNYLSLNHIIEIKLNI